MGGMLGLMYGVHYPDDLERLTVICPSSEHISWPLMQMSSYKRSPTPITCTLVLNQFSCHRRAYWFLEGNTWREMSNDTSGSQGIASHDKLLSAQQDEYSKTSKWREKFGFMAAQCIYPFLLNLYPQWPVKDDCHIPPLKEDSGASAGSPSLFASMAANVTIGDFCQQRGRGWSDQTDDLYGAVEDNVYKGDCPSTILKLLPCYIIPLQILKGLYQLREPRNPFFQRCKYFIMHLRDDNNHVYSFS